MNSPELNNYIQYVTRNGSVKTKSVVFVKNDINTTFEVKGIIEDYFILSVFENNIKKTGVGFENIDNNDMLAFINSNLFDINTIPQNSFLSPEEIVVMSYNNEYLNNLFNVTFPDIQKVENVAPDYKYIFYRDFLKSQNVLPNTVDLMLKQIILPANSIFESTLISFDSVKITSLITSNYATINIYITDDINNLKKHSIASFNIWSIPFYNYSLMMSMIYSGAGFTLTTTSPSRYSYLPLDNTKKMYISFMGSSPSNTLGSYSLDALSLSRLG